MGVLFVNKERGCTQFRDAHPISISSWNHHTHSIFSFCHDFAQPREFGKVLSNGNNWIRGHEAPYGGISAGIEDTLEENSINRAALSCQLMVSGMEYLGIPLSTTLKSVHLLLQH
jgi:hypothetical protein